MEHFFLGVIQPVPANFDEELGGGVDAVGRGEDVGGRDEGAAAEVEGGLEGDDP